ncbi:RNA polymerase sigma factor SigK [Arthrobacter sp. YC-RL1]|nr:RNA polymerase sigma factor SigK [Arthrobacter sp. LS16]ALQ31398.1 RNA polymerase subunit sigma [Arthrobacter sp. YC-RL1]KLI87330.1 RNA polymerase sigma factor SigK [Arthrobacter sp. YC-RL1]
MSSEMSDAVPEPVTAAPEELLRRIAGGDERAFEQFYDCLAPRVYGLVRRLLRDEAQSEEILQEVFVQAWQHAARFDPARGSAAGWLLTLAHRRTVDRIRSSQASRERDLRMGLQEIGTEYNDVEENAILHDESRRIVQALKRLSEAQRAAIELAYFGGYTHHEVADLLKIPVGTAKTRIRDGMIKLRDLMGVA